jgi:UDP-N-acetyl-2-amino-2-deoxyglucuronate dehydrogenase
MRKKRHDYGSMKKGEKINPTPLFKDKKGCGVKFALIGCGTIAKKHAIALGRLENAEMVGAYDIDKSATERLQKEHAIRAFSNIEQMIEETSPDVLNILTPSGDHGKRVLELMKYGKHFVVEKPLALRLDDIDKILEEASKRNISIFVVKQNRFNPPIRKLKDAIDKERFGKLVLGTVRVRWNRGQSYYDGKPWRGTWADDGGVLTNQASHHIDMLGWLMGDVESVMAKTATQLVNIEAEDTGIALVKFKGGALGVIEATTATRPKDLEGSISILGEKGAVEVGGFFMNELRTWNFAEQHEMDTEVRSAHSRVPADYAWSHTEFFKDVIESLQANRRGLIDGIEGRKSVELVNALYESAETGQEVFLRYIQKASRLGRG